MDQLLIETHENIYVVNMSVSISKQTKCNVWLAGMLDRFYFTEGCSYKLENTEIPLVHLYSIINESLVID